MSQNFIYVIFYVILHTLYGIFAFVYDLCFELKRRLTDHEVSVVREARKFDKTPTHLTLLLGEETHSINDLANLILWSLAAGISFVSIYDCKGQLKKRESELQSAVSEKLATGQHVIWHGVPQGYRNGYSGQKVHVKVLTESDGRGCVVNAAKVFAAAGDQDVNVGCIDRFLRKQYEFPDPDLGIYCGDVFSLYAYPPWQIRVTEFFGIRTHHNFSVKCFVEVLRKYNKCEQRLGK